MVSLIAAQALLTYLLIAVVDPADGLFEGAIHPEAQRTTVRSSLQVNLQRVPLVADGVPVSALPGTAVIHCASLHLIHPIGILQGDLHYCRAAGVVAGEERQAVAIRHGDIVRMEIEAYPNLALSAR